MPSLVGPIYITLRQILPISIFWQFWTNFRDENPLQDLCEVQSTKLQPSVHLCRRSWLNLSLTICSQSAKIWSTFAFDFFLTFWKFYWSIQSSFSFSFQKYKFFWNRTKIDIFIECFLMELFFCFCLPYCEQIVSHNVEGKSKWSRKPSHIVSEFRSHCEKVSGFI